MWSVKVRFSTEGTATYPHFEGGLGATCYYRPMSGLIGKLVFFCKAVEWVLFSMFLLSNKCSVCCICSAHTWNSTRRTSSCLTVCQLFLVGWGYVSLQFVQLAWADKPMPVWPASSNQGKLCCCDRLHGGSELGMFLLLVSIRGIVSNVRMLFLRLCFCIHVYPQETAVLCLDSFKNGENTCHVR